MTGRGVASLVTPAEPGFAAVDAVYIGARARWFISYRSAGTGVYIRIKADSLLAWAADPAAFPADGGS